MNVLNLHLQDKRHVIWDWNGTLLADLEIALLTVNQLLREANLPEQSLDQYRQHFGFPVVNYYQKLGFNTEPSEFLKLCERFNQLFYSRLPQCDLWPGARELLRSVKQAGKTQSVLSASEHNMLLQSMNHYQIRDLFDHVIGIFDKTAGSKVDRGRELIAHVNLPLKDTVLIGDTDHDLEVGEALGIEVILVEHGHQCPNRLKQRYSRVLEVLNS